MDLTIDKSLEIVNNYRPRSRFQLFPSHAPRSCKKAIILHKIDISKIILEELKEELILANNCVNTINHHLVTTVILDEFESLKFGLTSGNNMITSLNQNILDLENYIKYLETEGLKNHDRDFSF